MYLCICIYSYWVIGQGKRQPLNWLEMRPRLTLGQPEQNMVGGLKKIKVKTQHGGRFENDNSQSKTKRNKTWLTVEKIWTRHLPSASGERFWPRCYLTHFHLFWTCNPFYGSSIWMVGAFLLLRDTFQLDGSTRWLPATVCLVTMGVGWVRWMDGWVEVSVGNCEISKSKLRLAASF